MNSILIKNGILLDCLNKELVEGSSILIKKNKIIDLNSSKEKDVKIIDAKGKYILPGFIDTHSHVMTRGFDAVDTFMDPLSLYFYKAQENLKITLNSGITTLRDAGFADVGVKLASDLNLIKSPKLKITVMPLTITGGHFDLNFDSGFDMRINYPGFPTALCDGKYEVLKKTREIIRAKADFIKVVATGGVLSANDSPQDAQFTVEELKTCVDEAKFNSNKKVMSHAHGLKGINNSIDAGVHSIEHGTFVDEEAAKKMVKNGIYLCPTLNVMARIREYAENGTYRGEMAKKALETSKVHKENIQMAYEKGVKFTLGSDCGVTPHGENLNELKFFCEIGMDPFEAIATGTIKSAECLGMDSEIGSVEVGKIADLILVDENPIEDVAVLENSNNISLIVQDGKVVKKI